MPESILRIEDIQGWKLTFKKKHLKIEISQKPKAKWMSFSLWQMQLVGNSSSETIQKPRNS